MISVARLGSTPALDASLVGAMRFRQREADRRFGAILGLSLLLHAALFAAISAPDNADPIKLPPLLASLRPVNVPVPRQVVESAVTPAAAVAPKMRQPTARIESRPAPQVTQIAGPAKVAASSPSPRAAESSESAVTAAPLAVAAAEAVPAIQPVAAGHAQS